MILVNGYNAACDSWSCCGLAAKVCVVVVDCQGPVVGNLSETDFSGGSVEKRNAFNRASRKRKSKSSFGACW